VQVRYLPLESVDHCHDIVHIILSFWLQQSIFTPQWRNEAERELDDFLDGSLPFNKVYAYSMRAPDGMPSFEDKEFQQRHVCSNLLYAYVHRVIAKGANFRNKRALRYVCTYI
jgi:hypothetical protein